MQLCLTALLKPEVQSEMHNEFAAHSFVTRVVS